MSRLTPPNSNGRSTCPVTRSKLFPAPLAPAPEACRNVLPHSVANYSAMDPITVRDAPLSYSARMREPPIPTCTHQRNSSGCTGIWLELGSSSVTELFLCSTFPSSEHCSALTWLAVTTRSVGRLTSPIVTFGASLLVSADLDPFNRAGSRFPNNPGKMSDDSLFYRIPNILWDLRVHYSCGSPPRCLRCSCHHRLRVWLPSSFHHFVSSVVACPSRGENHLFSWGYHRRNESSAYSSSRSVRLLTSKSPLKSTDQWRLLS